MRAVAAVLSLFAALTMVASPAAAQATTVKVGTIGLLADIGLYVGVERGYFNERGLKIDMVSAASAGDMTAMLATNQLEFVGGGFSISLFNAIARGLPIRAIVGRAVLIPGYDNNPMMVRKDLADQVKTFRDLKGRKVALNSPVAPHVYTLGKAMESVGLTSKDVEVVTMPFPSMATAFTTKAIDAAISVEPFATLMTEKGLVIRWKGTAEMVPDPHMHISAYLVNHEWAERHPKVVQDFLAGYLRGLRVYYDALTTGRGRDEVVSLLVKYTAVKDRDLYERMMWQFADPNGAIGRRSIDDQIGWYHSHGLITKRLALDQVIDMRYLDAALKDIGTVPCPKCSP